jgi:hypothetical protein
MNRKQKLLTVFAIAILALASFQAPWQKITNETDFASAERTTRQVRTPVYAPIWQPPQPEQTYYAYNTAEFRLQWESVVLTWTAIGLVYAGLCWLFKNDRRIKPRPTRALPKDTFVLFDNLKELYWAIGITVFLFVVGPFLFNTDFWHSAKPNGPSSEPSIREGNSGRVSHNLSPQEIDAIPIDPSSQTNLKSTNAAAAAN